MAERRKQEIRAQVPFAESKLFSHRSPLTRPLARAIEYGE